MHKSHLEKKKKNPISFNFSVCVCTRMNMFSYLTRLCLMSKSWSAVRFDRYMSVLSWLGKAICAVSQDVHAFYFLFEINITKICIVYGKNHCKERETAFSIKKWLGQKNRFIYKYIMYWYTIYKRRCIFSAIYLLSLFCMSVPFCLFVCLFICSSVCAYVYVS